MVFTACTVFYGRFLWSLIYGDGMAIWDRCRGGAGPAFGLLPYERVMSFPFARYFDGGAIPSYRFPFGDFASSACIYRSSLSYSFLSSVGAFRGRFGTWGEEGSGGVARAIPKTSSISYYIIQMVSILEAWVQEMGVRCNGGGEDGECRYVSQYYHDQSRRMWSFDRNYRTITRRTFCMPFFLAHYPGTVLLLAMTMMIFITVKSRCRYPPNPKIGRSLSIKPEFSAPLSLPSLLHTLRRTR
jgi:hypothetical protein